MIARNPLPQMIILKQEGKRTRINVEDLPILGEEKYETTVACEGQEFPQGYITPEETGRMIRTGSFRGSIVTLCYVSKPTQRRTH